ncbi:hypothetical protein AKJ09_08044 [Labilithrix luteola]|uniref:Uncharacterized protein n=1 Tax=Labilithrix luteola TaxID=1391654 RepID=A0A0K1Q6C2_9BACT|nr:hypothetical protein AKJ09_08044 [Labilithrix luteola]
MAEKTPSSSDAGGIEAHAPEDDPSSALQGKAFLSSVTLWRRWRHPTEVDRPVTKFEGRADRREPRAFYASRGLSDPSSKVERTPRPKSFHAGVSVVRCVRRGIVGRRVAVVDVGGVGACVGGRGVMSARRRAGVDAWRPVGARVLRRVHRARPPLLVVARIARRAGVVGEPAVLASRSPRAGVRQKRVESERPGWRSTAYSPPSWTPGLRGRSLFRA